MVFVDPDRWRSAGDRHRLLDQPHRPGPEFAINVTDDPHIDTLSIEFAPGQVAESDEDKPGVVLDYDAAGHLVGLQNVDPSKRIADPASFHLRVAV